MTFSTENVALPLWSGTRLLVIFSARVSLFVGEYRCPAIHAASIEINGRSSTSGAGLASRPQDRNVIFVGIRCREQICCKNRGYWPAMRPTRCGGNIRGFEPPLLLPVHAALLAAPHGTLVAATTTTGSTHVAPGELVIGLAAQEASLGGPAYAAGAGLISLGGVGGAGASDQDSASHRQNGRWHQGQNQCAHAASPAH